jgi:hypothetical protein
MAPMVTDGHRNWCKWRQSLVPLVIGCTIGAIGGIAIGEKGTLSAIRDNGENSNSF